MIRVPNTPPSKTPRGRKDYRDRVRREAERQQLELMQEQTRIQVSRDAVNRRVRLDLIDASGEVLARVYLNFDRAKNLIGAIGRAILG